MSSGDVWRPETVEDFKTWYAGELGYDDQVDRDRYAAASRLMLAALAASEFWTDLALLMPELSAAYEVDTGYPLFVASPVVPELQVKPFDSLIEKVWRRNYLNNPNWPRPPEQGWITPENWYERIGDLVRTTVVVKYLDGVGFVRGNIEALALDCGVPCAAVLTARREGYYAAHVDVGFPVELPPRSSWNAVRSSAHVEIQITTQLQEVIRRLLHRQYESDRIQGTPEDWEWDYRGEAFRVKYLGHVLHYLEGKIMDERERTASVRS